MRIKDIGFKLIFKCMPPLQRLFDDDPSNTLPELSSEMQTEMPHSSSFKITDTLQLKPDSCLITEIEADFESLI